MRRYQSKPIPGALARRLVHAATLAPSAHNRQPWRFALIHDFDRKSQLATAMGQRLRKDRLRDGDPLERIDKDVARSYARISSAPLVIVACMSLVDMDRYPDRHRTDAERTMAVQSVAMACQNLLLAAHAEGLGASWMCAPLFCPDIVCSLLGLPGDWEPQALLTLGLPAEPGKPMSRRPLEAVSRVI